MAEEGERILTWEEIFDLCLDTLDKIFKEITKKVKYELKIIWKALKKFGKTVLKALKEPVRG